MTEDNNKTAKNWTCLVTNSGKPPSHAEQISDNEEAGFFQAAHEIAEAGVKVALDECSEIDRKAYEKDERNHSGLAKYWLGSRYDVNNLLAPESPLKILASVMVANAASGNIFEKDVLGAKQEILKRSETFKGRFTLADSSADDVANKIFSAMQEKVEKLFPQKQQGRGGRG